MSDGETMNKQLREQLCDATVRIEAMIHLGGMSIDSYSLPETLNDLLMEDDDTLSSPFPGIPAWVKEALSSRDDRGPAFVEWICQENKLGFVVQFATPVMRDVDEHGGGTYSWGYYYTRWIYGETLEDAIKKAMVWAAERRANELDKQRTGALEK